MVVRSWYWVAKLAFEDSRLIALNCDGGEGISLAFMPFWRVVCKAGLIWYDLPSLKTEGRWQIKKTNGGSVAVLSLGQIAGQGLNLVEQ